MATSCGAAADGVTLIMPVRNEAASLPDVLASLQAQTFDHRRLFFVAADGESTDGSAALIRSWLASSDIAGVVVTNYKHTIPGGLNTALAHADPASYIVRLDSHTLYAPGYLAAIMAAYPDAPADVGCLGGAQIPAEPRSAGEAVVVSLFCNPMGLGGADFRTATTPRIVDGVYLGAWRPGIVQAVGGFDERWRANEDSELMLRLRTQGWKTLWIPLECRYRIKRGPVETVTQWMRYGYWRAQTLVRYPQAVRLRHIVPPLALVAAVVLAFTPFRALLALGFAAYSVAVLAKRPRRDPLWIALAGCIFFPACQMAYAGGLIAGFLGAAFRVLRPASKADCEKPARP
jgi:succinoglycan biosynthesis protein ExoA